MRYVTESAACARPLTMLSRGATFVLMSLFLTMLIGCCGKEPLVRTERVTVVETRTVGVPEELTEKRAWPEYPPHPLTCADTILLAEEFKDRWVGCRGDKDKIFDLKFEDEGANFD